MGFDWDTSKSFIGGCFGVIGILGTALYKGTQSRIKKVEVDLDAKASEVELERARGHIVDLFKENAKIREEMTSGFSAISKDMHEMHIDIIDRLEQRTHG